MQSSLLRRSRTALALALAGVMTVATVSSAFAAAPSQQTEARQGLFGSVTAKGDTSLTLHTKQGTDVTLAVDGATAFHVPGEATATLADVPVGSRVAVLAQGAQGAQSAARIMVIPGEPEREHRVLTIVEVNGKTVVAEDAQGNRVEVELDEALSEDAVGQLTTFVAEKSQQSNRFKAQAEVKIRNIVERMQAQAAELEAGAKAAKDERDRAVKERVLADVKVRLEANLERHLDVAERVIANAPEEAKERLRAALENSARGYEKALEVAGRSRAEAEARLRVRGMEGSVEAVDTAAGAITVVDEDGNRLVLSVAQDTKFVVNAKTGALDMIAAGDHVSVRYDPQTSAAVMVVVQNQAAARGAVRSVDGGKLTIAMENGATLTVNITNGTRIKINGRDATPADLKVNLLVGVAYDQRTLNALVVEARTVAVVHGAIQAVDALAGTVTIQGENSAAVTLKVTPDTRVQIRGILFGVLGVQAGMKAVAEYDTSTNVASSIIVAGKEPEARERGGEGVVGEVSAVNTAAGTATIKLDRGGEVTLKVTADTKVRVNEQPAALADLAAGARVVAEYDRDTMTARAIIARVAMEMTAKGIIRAVAGGEKVVIVATDAGNALPLRVSDATRISVKGAAATLADLGAQTGAAVAVKYQSLTNVATEIQVTGDPRPQTARLEGVIKAVDVQAGTVTVVTLRGELVLSVKGDTAITVDGADVKLDALAGQTGSRVGAEYAADTRVAVRINVRHLLDGRTVPDLREPIGSGTPAERTDDGRTPPPPRDQGTGQVTGRVTASGTLSAVDVVAGTVTIATEKGALTLKVTSESRIVVAGAVARPVVLAKAVGGRVNVVYNAETHVVVALEVRG